MPTCDFCGSTQAWFKCKYCGGSFCTAHINPQLHDCKAKPSVQEIERAGLPTPLTVEKAFKLPAVKGKAAKEELGEVVRLETEFNQYLDELVHNRLERTINFGKDFSALNLVIYLRKLFGKTLFFDSLLSITQQYSASDVEIKSEIGALAGKTGFNLALFGHPGTGKTFAAYDMICGNTRAGVPAHGIIGRNRYCGGFTPAKFIDVGQAYEGRKYVFIVTEFNDWFKYKGMVEPLKLAMEGKEIRKETMHGTVGPYKFTSFFSVNYNVSVKEAGYRTTVGDPNFNAIEDRMLCRLHRLTIDRFKEIADAQQRVKLGTAKFDIAELIRDHATLMYAIQTQHPLIKDELPQKPILLTEKDYDKMIEARQAILEHLKYEKDIPFSPRLEWRALQLASAMTLMSYFKIPADKDVLPIDPYALRLGIRFYVEEASIRSKEEFSPEHVLFDLGIFWADETAFKQP